MDEFRVVSRPTDDDGFTVVSRPADDNFTVLSRPTDKKPNTYDEATIAKQGAAKRSEGVNPDGSIPGVVSLLDPRKAGENWTTIGVDQDGLNLTYAVPTVPGGDNSAKALGERLKKNPKNHFGAFETEDAAANFMRSHAPADVADANAPAQSVRPPLSYSDITAMMRGKLGDMASAAVPPNELPNPNAPAESDLAGAVKGFENIPAQIAQLGGAAMRYVGEEAPKLGPVVPAFAQADALNQLKGTPTQPTAAERFLASKGGSIADAAQKDIDDNTPNVRPFSAGGIAYQTIQSAPMMIGAAVLTMLTKNPMLGAVSMGVGTGVQEYGQERTQGVEPDKATLGAAVNGFAESLGEEIPLEMLMRPGGTFLSRTLKTAGAEGVQEMVTQIIQTGYDKEVLDPNMSWGEAWSQVVQAGIVGAVMGGGLATAAHPFAGTGAVIPTPQHGAPPPKPKGTIEAAQVQRGQAMLTPEDKASPIPDDVIAQGKAMIDDILKGAGGQNTPIPSSGVSPKPEVSTANTILRRNAWPDIGSPVDVTRDGKPEAGTVVDAFSANVPELGTSDDGIKVRMQDGKIFEAFKSELAASGATVTPRGAGAAQEAGPTGEAPASDEFTVVSRPGPAGDGTRENPVDVTHPDHMEPVRGQVNTEPTEPQKDAENYKMGHMTFQGLPLTIENPKGSVRSKTNAETGESWSVTMPADYGKIKGTVGNDGDQMDAYVGPNPQSQQVFIIDQQHAGTTKFDEHKVMLGFDSKAQAEKTYVAGFSDGKGLARIQSVVPLTMEQFKDYLENGDHTETAAEHFPTLAEHPSEYVAELKTDDVMFDRVLPMFRAAMAAKYPDMPSWKDPKSAAGVNVAHKLVAAIRRGEFNEALYPTNPMARSIFEKVTGVKLPNTIKGSKAIVEAKSWLQKGQEPGSLSGGGGESEAAPAKSGAPTSQAGEPKAAAPSATAPAKRNTGETVQPKAVDNVGESTKVITRIPNGERSVWTEIGKNEDGHPLYEDQRKVRSYVENGVRITEPVGLRHAKAGIEYTVQRPAEKGFNPQEKPNVNEPGNVPAPSERGGAEPVGKPAVQPRAGSERSGQQGPGANETGAQGGAGGRSGEGGQRAPGKRSEVAAPGAGERAGGVAKAPAQPNPKTEPGRQPAPDLSGTVNDRAAFRGALQANSEAQWGGKTYKVEKYRADGGLSMRYAVKVADTKTRSFITDGESHQNRDEAIQHAFEAAFKQAESKTRPPANEPKAEPKSDELAGGAPGAVKKQGPVAPPLANTYGDTNKVFTKSDAEKAREILRAKLKGQFSAGLDPELVQAGITLAGYHIEAGARSFADYAKAMLDDLGEGVRPYLKSWYNAVRDYPGIIAGGMTPYDEITPELISSVKVGEPNDERPQESPVGTPGVGEPGSDVAAGKPGGTPTAPVLGNQSAENVSGNGGRGAGIRSRAGQQGARSGATVPEGGNAAAGRTGAGEPGVSNAAARSGRPKRNAQQPAGTRPNYHITDPEKLFGGGPKARFARNKSAIEAYRAITEEGREPTQNDLDAMAGYIGWGSFGQELFQGSWQYPYPKDEWRAEDKWLREHLGKDEWESAQRSIINAHYTDPPTVEAMWNMAKAMGFKGGRVLEPSMGVGNFFGLMPRDMMGESDLTGIEMDRLTGGMAKLLYPHANVQIKPYQDSKTADNFYDLVIGNWPFAAEGPADRRYAKLGASLHDFFFVKALDQVRPGGLVMGITSAGTMDKVGRAVRLHLARNAELVAAFRLPSGAFEKYAGTGVVTDVIILRKRAEPVTEIPEWTESEKAKVGYGEINLNTYFRKNPDRILGKLNYGHGTTSGRPGMIVEREPNFPRRLSALATRVPADTYQEIKRGKETRFIANTSADREGSVTVKDDKLYVVNGERMDALEDVVPYRVANAKTTAAREDQLKRLVAMRRAYGELINSEREGAADTEQVRGTLKRLYDDFRRAHGPIIDSEGASILARVKDPYRPALLALEAKDGTPARILSEATIRSKRKVDNPSIRDAFVMARNESTHVDLPRVAELSGRPVEEIEKELLDSKAIYRTPGEGYEVADQYLSGNVRRKLREAEDAKAAGEDMDASIEALRSVIPKDVPYFSIEAQMGAPWVSNEHYGRFIAELLGVKDADEIAAKFTAGRWTVKFDNDEYNNRPEAKSTWGHPDVKFNRLLENAFNNTTVTIRRKDSDGKEYVDEDATAKANEKITRIRENFNGWVWKDAGRRIELEKNYNEVMNAIAAPKYDGSFLELSGMALRRGNDAFSLRQHQLDAIWRGVINQRGIYAHEVGTGKTYTMAGIAVESRRYGLARKPLIFAHNANSVDVAAGIKEMYPGANVLHVDNLTPAEIDTTLRRIANDDWDAVVVPHSLIDRFALTKETLESIAAEEIAALEQEAIDAAQEDGQDLDLAKMNDEKAMQKLRSPTAKQLVHQRNHIIKMIDDTAQRSSREGAIPFEELGVDMVMVDEVQEFKKPPLATKMRIRGLNTNPSNRSIALRFLTDYVKRQGNGKGVHTFTGTPITNTLAEIYQHMRYVMDDQMAKDGVKDWDPWFNTFAAPETSVELTAAGEYEPVTRLSSFVNVAELRRMAGQYLDIVFADDMPEFKPRATTTGKTLDSPNLSDAEREQLTSGHTDNPVGRPYKKIVNDVGQMAPQQLAALKDLAQRAREFKNASKKERREMMLKGDPRIPVIVETEAANAGLDVRLYDPNASDHPESKVNRAVRNVLRIYKEEGQASQVIFVDRGYSDTSTRSKRDAQGHTIKDKDGKPVTEKVARFNLAKDLVEKLTKGGIPASEVMIVDGGVSKQRRKEIADKMNAGTIRVVIGLTNTLGVGVNMQRRLRAMHHLDAPWMPGDLEQRNGRGWRQGNIWNTVQEYRYITDKLDGRRWQVLAIKDKFIKAFLKADDTVRIIEGDAVSLDEGESVNDLEETLSQAAGDPRILIKNKLQADIRRLENREHLHSAGIYDAEQRGARLGREIVDDTRTAGRLDTDAAAWEATKGTFSATIDGKEYTERKAAEAALDAIVPKIAKNDNRVIGTIQGMPLEVRWFAGYPSYGIRGASGQTYEAKPSVASVEATARQFTKRANDLREGIADKTASITRMDEAAKLPFQQQAILDKKRQQLKDLLADLQASPEPPPGWLVNGAPVLTSIWVQEPGGASWNREERTVEGHKWTPQGYFVATDKGDVPYMDALQRYGEPVYEPHEFIPPPVKEAPKPATPAPTGKTLDREVDRDRTYVDPEGAPRTAEMIANGASLHDVLAHIADEAKNKDMRIVARALGKVLPEGFDFRAMTDREATNQQTGNLRSGFFNPEKLSIRVHLGLTTHPDQTLLHEAIHAATYFAIEGRTPAGRELVKLFRAYESMAGAGKSWSAYGFKSAHEFVAEALSNPEFRAQLNGIKAGGNPTGLWERFVNAIRRMLGYLPRDPLARILELEPALNDTTNLLPRLAAESYVRKTGGKELEAPVRRTPAASVNVAAFDDPAAERRFQEASKGIGNGNSVFAQAREWWDFVKAGFGRHWLALPNEARYADLQQQLRKLESGWGSSNDEIVRIMRRLVGDLSKPEFELFRRKVILDDLSWEVAQDHEIPFGLSAADVPAELAKIDTELTRHPDLVDRVRERRLAVRRIADQLVAAGVLSKEQVKNPSYYRHQVLDYARLMRAGAAKSRLRTPYWAKREGSKLDINANYLEAEMDWLRKALNDIKTAETIGWIKDSNHNIRDRVAGAAKAHNDAIVQRRIAADMRANGFTLPSGRQTSPLNEVFVDFKMRIAMGFSRIANELSNGSIVPPPEFQAAATAIENGVADDDAFAFLGWMLDTNQVGSVSAATVFQAIAHRRQAVQDLLGEQYADPKDIKGLVDRKFAPEGYVSWQPDEGKLLYTSKTLPEHAINRFMRNLAQDPTATAATLGVTNPADPNAVELSRKLMMAVTDAARSVLAVGGDKYTMVLPQEVADTLNSLKDEAFEGIFGAVAEVPLRLWKQWVLFNPMRVGKYFLNNASGDIDAVIAGNPKVVMRLPQATRELWSVMVKKEAPTQEYRDAVERGVFNAGLTLQEIPDINALSDFAHLAETDKPIKNFLLSPWRKAWNGIRGANAFRENMLRYSAYLHYHDQLDAGVPMAKIGYGASNPEMVDAVTSNKDRAALLARDLVGDYGAISHFGRGIRRTMVPFWSWMEINSKRYLRLTGNAWRQGVGQGLATTGALGGLMGVRVTGYLLLRMVAMYALVQLWNRLRYGDDEDKLDPEQARQLHILLGHDSQGEIQSLRIQGAVSDFLSWFGFEDAVGALSEVSKGRGSMWDVLGAIAGAPVNKIANSITPMLSVPIELASGQTYFPDVFTPRPIHDRWREVFRLFNLDPAYDAVLGKPTRGVGHTLAGALLYQRDPNEIAYDEARGLAYDYMRRTRGESGVGADSTDRSEALREWRLALRYGDEDAAKRAVERMRELGMHASDIRESIKRANPLGPVPLKDRRKFLDTLTERERTRLEAAKQWYKDTYVSEGRASLRR